MTQVSSVLFKRVLVPNKNFKVCFQRPNTHTRLKFVFNSTSIECKRYFLSDISEWFYWAGCENQNQHAYWLPRYSHLKNCLSVTVKSVRELVSRDSPGKTNPLVRLYLLPDRSKRSRRVTRVMKGTLNCVFNETFEYMIGLDQLGTMKIDVAVKSDRGFAIGRVRHRLIGLAVVDLSGKHLTEGCDVSCELRKFSLTFWMVLEKMDQCQCPSNRIPTAPQANINPYYQLSVVVLGER